MAKRLTAEMVVARTKICDLSKIKRLNCWGSDLVDVSLLREMPSVEVLSLSINKINSLSDFQFCKRLEELYVRQNDIRDLNEVVYLQSLTNLKNLWLGENPCANIEGYRLAVLKALPHLQKLDTVQVTEEEIREAQLNGISLTHPENVTVTNKEETVSKCQEPQSCPPRNEPDYKSEDWITRQEILDESFAFGRSPRIKRTPPRRPESARVIRSPEHVSVEKRRNSFEKECPKIQSQSHESSPSVDQVCESQTPTTEYICKEVSVVKTLSPVYVKQERWVHPRPLSTDIPVARSQEIRERCVCSATPSRTLTGKRPTSRNSNILTAVLRLIKELDYPSLEIVEMEARARLDELAEDP